ncbi:unnamed protein product [Echinostoma caproni]|uniref:Uncharacterized protein n=1 Tax=Echinostoma caproni TaxID=27848 RepID=A0A183AA11_9TREM|nr:unnamed protein product [Echinostoma caproni]
MERHPLEDESLASLKITICGTCGRRDTHSGHPPLGNRFVSCEYPYGYHNPKNAPLWLTRTSLQQMINHYAIGQILAEERCKLQENTPENIFTE